MRSRPDLAVYLDPKEPSAGDRLHAHIRLTSKSETPYDSIDVLLVGNESRYKRTDSTGETSVRKYHRREILRLGKVFPGGVFKPGTFTQTVYFDLPADAPPTYKSALATIEYALSVRVRIPWWPDKHETYVVTVRVPARPESPEKPRVFTTQMAAERGKEPVIELSLEDQTWPLGGTVRGAVAFTGLGTKRLRRVELAISTIETSLVQSAAMTAEVDRRVYPVFEGTPAEGAALPFKLGIPADLSPSFFSPFIRVEHALEVVAVVAFDRDLTLRAPIVLGRPIEGANQSRQRKKENDVPLVGKQRHVALWRAGIEAMRAAGHPITASDPEKEMLTLNVRGIHATVTEEHRDALGPCLVAELLWPTLGLSLRVAERRWTDFGTKHAGLDALLQDRFTVRVREPAQAAYLLAPDTRDALGVFEEAALDDDGAIVVQKGGVYQIGVLERFLSRVEMLATRISQSIQNLPPPAALVPALDAFARFSERQNATLRVGDLAISGITLQGIVISLEHRFEEAQPVESRLFAARPESAEPEEIQRLLQKATNHPVLVEADRIGVRLPLVLNPEDVLATADAFAAAVLMLSGTHQKGPYR